MPSSESSDPVTTDEEPHNEDNIAFMFMLTTEESKQTGYSWQDRQWNQDRSSRIADTNWQWSEQEWLTQDEPRQKHSSRSGKGTGGKSSSGKGKSSTGKSKSSKGQKRTAAAQASSSSLAPPFPIQTDDDGIRSSAAIRFAASLRECGASIRESRMPVIQEDGSEASRSARSSDSDETLEWRSFQRTAKGKGKVWQPVRSPDEMLAATDAEILNPDRPPLTRPKSRRIPDVQADPEPPVSRLSHPDRRHKDGREKKKKERHSEGGQSSDGKEKKKKRRRRAAVRKNARSVLQHQKPSESRDEQR